MAPLTSLDHTVQRAKSHSVHMSVCPSHSWSTPRKNFYLKF